MSLRRLGNGSLVMSKGSRGCSAIHAQTSGRGAAEHGTNAFKSRWRHQRGDNNRRRSDASAKYSPQTTKDITTTLTMSRKTIHNHRQNSMGGFGGCIFACFFLTCVFSGSMSANIASKSFFHPLIFLGSWATVEKHMGGEQSFGG